MTKTYGIRMRALRHQVVVIEDNVETARLWPTHELRSEAEEDIARRVRRDRTVEEGAGTR